MSAANGGGCGRTCFLSFCVLFMTTLDGVKELLFAIIKHAN
jgi:hypothetical protein